MVISEVIKKIDFEALLNIADILDIDTQSQEDLLFRSTDSINEAFFSLIREIIRTQFNDVECRITRNQQGLSVSIKTEGLEDLIQFANDHRFNSFNIAGSEETDGITAIKDCINMIVVPTFSNFNNGSTFTKRNGRIVFYFEFVNAYNDYSLQLTSNGIFEMVSYVEKIKSYNINTLNQLLEDFNALAETARQVELERAAEREAQQRAIRDARIAREAQVMEDARIARQEAERVENERREEEARQEAIRQAAENERLAAENAMRERLRAAGANDEGIEIAIRLGLIDRINNG